MNPGCPAVNKTMCLGAFYACTAEVAFMHPCTCIYPYINKHAFTIANWHMSTNGSTRIQTHTRTRIQTHTRMNSCDGSLLKQAYIYSIHVHAILVFMNIVTLARAGHDLTTCDHKRKNCMRNKGSWIRSNDLTAHAT